MRFHKLDLNLLVALDVLLAERSITRAAKRLHLSQSSTSGVLARLREYFKDELLTQVGRNMVPTPLAESLSNPVRSILLQIHSTIETRPAFVPEESDRHFRVIASDYPTSVLLADVTRQLGLLAPKITMEILAPDDAPADRLDRGEVDIMILPEKYMLPGHPSEMLYEDTLSCMIWASNTLVTDSLPLEQYLSLGHVATSWGGRRLPGLEEWFLKNAGLTRHIEISVGNFNSLPLLVIGTNRVATMHTRLGRMFANYYPVRLLKAPMEMPPVVMRMQWHRFFDTDPGHVWFRQLVSRVAAFEKADMVATHGKTDIEHRECR
jgi:DNA-binding transcriptional LysR family regulator